MSLCWPLYLLAATVATEFEIIPHDSAVNSGDNPNGGSNGLPRMFSRTISGTTYQVCGVWTSANVMAIGVRSRTDNEAQWSPWMWHKTAIPWTGTDAHHSIAVVIDADGFLHVCYDQHNDALRYAKSNAALSTWTGTMTTGLSMLGTNETIVTYPTFFVSPTGTLYFMFRGEGGSGSGNLYFYEYDETTPAWSAAAGTDTGGRLIFGKTGTPTQSPYWFGLPAFSSDWDGAGTGFMHFMFFWRETSDAATNHDASHLKWDGSTFRNMAGTAITVPVTFASASTDSLIVNAIAQSTGFDGMSQAHALDSNDNPHCAYQKNDGSGDVQLWHLHYNGSSWVEDQLTAMVGATRVGYADQTLAIDTDNDIVYVLYGHSAAPDGIRQIASDPGDFTTWTETALYTNNCEAFSACYDPAAWERDGEFTFLNGYRVRSGSSLHQRLKILTRIPDGTEAAFSTTIWQRKCPLTHASAQVGTGGVSGFMTLLTRDCFPDEMLGPTHANRSQADGGDLRFFTDSSLTTQLPCFVEKWEYDSSNGAGDADVAVWIKRDHSDSADGITYVAYNTTSRVWQPWIEDTYGQFAVKPASLLYHWPFRRTTCDHAADSNRRTSFADAALTYSGGGLSFPGTSGEYLHGQDKALGIPDACTLLATVNPDNTATVKQIFSTDTSGTTLRNFQFRVNSTGELRLMRFTASNVFVVDITGTTNLNTAGPSRVAGAFDETTGAEIFVNGTSEGTDASTDAINDSATSRLRIGENDRTTAETFDGVMAHLEIHNVVLSDAWLTTDTNNRTAPATFTTAGTPEATVASGETLDADSGSFTLTGNAADLLKGTLAIAEAGSLALTGQTANLLRSHVLTAESGTFAITGNDATLSKQAAGNTTLEADPGSFAITGQQATLVKQWLMTLDSGPFTLTGGDATFSEGMTLFAESGVYNVTGQDATFSKQWKLAANQGQYLLTGQAANLFANELQIAQRVLVRNVRIHLPRVANVKFLE